MQRADKRRVTRAIRALVPELRETRRGGLLVMAPRGRILRGIFLEDSSEPDVAYVWAFVQPLYVPSEHLVLSLGIRLGGGRMHDGDDADAIAALVRREGLPVIASIVSPEALAASLARRTDAFALEARGYSLVAAGRFAEGAAALRGYAAASAGDDRAWAVEQRRRAERVADLAEAAPADATALLARWEAETAAALRVDGLP